MKVELCFLFDSLGVTGGGIRKAGERAVDLSSHKGLQFVVFDKTIWDACYKAKTTLLSFLHALAEASLFDPLSKDVGGIVGTARRLDAQKQEAQTYVDLRGPELLGIIQKLEKKDFEPAHTGYPVQRFKTSYGDFTTAIGLLGEHAHLIQVISCAAPYEWWSLPGRDSSTQEGLQNYADNVDTWKRRGKLIMRITAVRDVDDLKDVWPRILARFESDDNMIQRWCESLSEHMLNDLGERKQKATLEKVLEKLQQSQANGKRDQQAEKDLTQMILKNYIEGLHNPQDTAVYVASKQGPPKGALPSYLCEQVIYDRTWYIKLEQSEIVDTVTGEFGPLALRVGLLQTWLREFRRSYFAEKGNRGRGQLKKFLKGG